MNQPLEMLIGLLTGAIFATLALVFWPRKGKWGINLAPVDCPRCRLRMPRHRWPANKRQLLWGGWTCRHCNCEMDKYGKEIADLSSTDSSGA